MKLTNKWTNRRSWQDTVPGARWTYIILALKVALTSALISASYFTALTETTFAPKPQVALRAWLTDWLNHNQNDPGSKYFHLGPHLGNTIACVIGIINVTHGHCSELACRCNRRFRCHPATRLLVIFWANTSTSRSTSRRRLSLRVCVARLTTTGATTCSTGSRMSLRQPAHMKSSTSKLPEVGGELQKENWWLVIYIVFRMSLYWPAKTFFVQSLPLPLSNNIS